NGGRAVIDWHLCAVRSQDNRVVCQPDHKTFPNDPSDWIVHGPAGLPVHDLEALGQWSTDDLGFWPPEQLNCYPVCQAHHPCSVGCHNCFPNTFKGAPPPFLALMKCSLSLLLLSDIAGDLGDTDYRSMDITDGGDGQRNVDEPAVFSSPESLVMVDAFAPTKTCKDVFFLVMERRRDDQQYRLSDGFFDRIAENSHSRFIPCLDDAGQILTDDGIVGGVDDRRQIGWSR